MRYGKSIHHRFIFNQPYGGFSQTQPGQCLSSEMWMGYHIITSHIQWVEVSEQTCSPPSHEDYFWDRP